MSEPHTRRGIPKTNLAALFSSRRMDWVTPQPLFDAVHAEFGFTLDAAASPENAKVGRFFTSAEDGLCQDWGTNRVWLNPPYGREIGRWLYKARESAASGATVVCLVPARTDTAWWHDFVQGYAEVRFLRGRVRFEGGLYTAPFPSAVVVYRPNGGELA